MSIPPSVIGDRIFFDQLATIPELKYVPTSGFLAHGCFKSFPSWSSACCFTSSSSAHFEGKVVLEGCSVLGEVVHDRLLYNLRKSVSMTWREPRKRKRKWVSH